MCDNIRGSAIETSAILAYRHALRTGPVTLPTTNWITISDRIASPARSLRVQ